MAGCSGPNCCTPPTRQADQQARLLWANQGLMAQNSSKVLLKSFFQALLQPALSAQAKDLQLGPALGAIHWRNAAHGAVLRDGSSGEVCQQDSGGGSGVLGTQFSSGQGEADQSRGGRHSPLGWRALLLPWWQLHLAVAQVAVKVPRLLGPWPETAVLQAGCPPAASGSELLPRIPSSAGSGAWASKVSAERLSPLTATANAAASPYERRCGRRPWPALF